MVRILKLCQLETIPQDAKIYCLSTYENIDTVVGIIKLGGIYIANTNQIAYKKMYSGINATLKGATLSVGENKTISLEKSARETTLNFLLRLISAGKLLAPDLMSHLHSGYEQYSGPSDMRHLSLGTSEYAYAGRRVFYRFGPSAQAKRYGVKGFVEENLKAAKERRDNALVEYYRLLHRDGLALAKK